MSDKRTPPKRHDTIAPTDFLPPAVVLAWSIWWRAVSASNSTPVDTLPARSNDGE